MEQSVYLVEEQSGGFKLEGQQGLSTGFVQSAAYFGRQSSAHAEVHYGSLNGHGAMGAMVEQLKAEGLRALEVIPIQHVARVRRAGCSVPECSGTSSSAS